MDVTILGDGPAGCATAIALRRAGVGRVLLVGGQSQAPKSWENASPTLRPLLDNLGISEAFLLQRHEPCHGSASAWGQADLSYSEWRAPPWGHGWHLDRQRFDDWMVEEAVASGARWLPETRVDQVMRSDDGFEVPGLAEPTRLLVDATGAASHLARMLSVHRRIEDQLTFLCGSFERAALPPHGPLTMLEALRDGWWHAIKLSDGRVAATFCTDGETARREALHEPAAWSHRLSEARHIARLATEGASPDRIVTRSGSSSRLHRTAGDGWLAVGDAAACWDPLVSMGICKALQDGLHAARALRASLAGDSEATLRYAREYVERFDHYRRTRASFYAAEKRWFYEPFWQNRRNRSTNSPVSTSGEWPIPTPA